MNATSRAILQTVLATDASLSPAERSALQQTVDGLIGLQAAPTSNEERLLLTQKASAKLLSVSRVTIWRMTKDGILHPVEILAGMWRYSYREVAALARGGVGINATASAGRREMSVA